MAELNKYLCVRACPENTRCGKGKQCLCDDECGISCVRTGKNCADPQDEPSLGSYYVRRHTGRRQRVRFATKPYLFGDVAAYRCERGVTLRGPLPRCQANGNWSNEIPQCVDTRCPGDPPLVLHSTGGHVSRIVRGRPYIIRQPPYNTGDIFNYVCESGRALQGHLPICNNGNWSQELPKCIDYNQCGQSGQTRNVNANIGRVVGGEDAMEDTWPWFVLITEKSSTPEMSLEPEKLKGGGSIINKHWMLTAAHVLHRLDLNEYVIFVGLSERPSKTEFVKSSVKMYAIAEYVEHTDFNVATSYDNDIALIKLGQRLDQSMQHTNADDDAGLTFGLSIRAICLPGCTTYSSESNQNHLRCPWSGNVLPRAANAPIIIGFGHVYAALHGTVNKGNFHPPKKLQQATVKIKEQSWCGRELERARTTETTYIKRRLHLTENMICCKSDQQNGIDACYGDSGGPLMKEMIDGETGTSYWVQIGIVSFGIGCASGYPGYYTKVERYTSWIQNAISDSMSGTSENRVTAEARVGICTRNISLVEEGRRCRKPCETRRDCSASNKRCYCDGACGMTCLNRMSECPTPDPPVNGNVTWNHRRWGSKACYSCSEGYTLEGNECRTCNADKNWGGTTPSCEDYNKCGQSGKTRNVAYANLGLVVGGEDAMEDIWPWFAQITRKSSTPEKSLSKRNLVGGGTIINKHWILTTAHLLDGFALNNYVVFVGLTERPSWQEFVKSSVEMYSIATFVRHPNYGGEQPLYDNDIGLIKLGQKLDQSMQPTNADNVTGLTFGPSIRAICLPGCATYQSESNQIRLRCPWSGNVLPRATDDPIIIGFGHTRAVVRSVSPSNFNPSKRLQQATVRIKEPSWCQQQLGRMGRELNIFGLEFTENMMCCGSDQRNRKDACQGDDGGPLMKEMVDEETRASYWVQIGIVSFGFGCASEYPGYYTKVERFTPWIQDVIGP